MGHKRIFQAKTMIERMLLLKNVGAAWLGQLVEGRTAVLVRSRVQAPDRTNNQGLKITEENVLPL